VVHDHSKSREDEDVPEIVCSDFQAWRSALSHGMAAESAARDALHDTIAKEIKSGRAFSDDQDRWMMMPPSRPSWWGASLSGEQRSTDVMKELWKERKSMPYIFQRSSPDDHIFDPPLIILHPDLQREEAQDAALDYMPAMFCSSIEASNASRAVEHGLGLRRPDVLHRDVGRFLLLENRGPNQRLVSVMVILDDCLNGRRPVLFPDPFRKRMFPDPFRKRM
jgi:hypothetical protein